MELFLRFQRGRYIMITSLEKCKIGYVFGVRYKRTFMIADNLGAITDDILQSKKSKLKASLFPYIQHNDRDEDVLFDFLNGQPQNRLTINTSNIILDVQNLERIPYETGVTAFRETILKNVMQDYKIGSINRIGFINRYIISDSEIIKKFIDGTVGRGVEDVNDINLQFSKRLEVTESIVKQDVNDYQNVIVNIIKKNGRDELFVSVDFQHYYSPMIERATMINFDKFLKDAELYTNNQILAFLNNTYGESNGK